MSTYFNLVNIYFYEDVFNATYQNRLLNLTNMNSSQLNQTLRVDNGFSSMYQLMEYFVKPMVKTFYANESFCAKGAQQLTNECSFRQLAYGQWAEGLLTDKPMHNM